MARSWRDYETGSPTCDNTDNRDKTAFETVHHGSFVPIVSSVTALPSAISSGLVTLKSMAAPRLQRPERWPRVVSDALRLARDGWAAKALALGWSPLDLFGAGADEAGDPFADGLVVRLESRPIIASCASFATIDAGTGGRVFLHRATNEGARLLWSLGQ